jgi:hypothetical protein
MSTVELPRALAAALDQAGGSDELRRQAVRLSGVDRLAELFGAVSTTVELTPAPDPIERARAERAWALHHTGAWPGPPPRSPYSGALMRPPTNHRIRTSGRTT